MTAYMAARRGAVVCAMALAAALSGCASIDQSLFGNSGGGDQATEAQPAGGSEPGTMPATGSEGQTSAPSTASTETSSSMAGTMPAPVATAPMAVGATVAPVSIEAGNDTGTAVSHTIAGLRSDLQGLESRIVSNDQQFVDLRNANLQSSTAYHEAKAQITTRLQIGTTRGNPELVSQWNTAQSSLDQLTTNINALNSLGTQIADASSRAHYLLNQIQGTRNISGAVDEDHRQLTVLEDETDQTIVLIDRLMTEVSDTVQRQTSYVANERANLTTLASAIKNGELYGSELGSEMLPGASPVPGTVPTGAPLVTIRFDRASVDYQQILYSALAQALQSRPTASFDVVGVSPTRGTAAAVQQAQTNARRRSQDVMRSMMDMGVPANRIGLSATTDPSVAAVEIRVYVR